MKSNYNKDFDRRIKQKFENFSPEVPAGVWLEIARQRDSAVVKEPDATAAGKRGFVRLRNPYLSIAASLLLVAFIYWKFQPEERITLRRVAQSTTHVNAPVLPTEGLSPKAISSTDYLTASPSTENNQSDVQLESRNRILESHGKVPIKAYSGERMDMKVANVATLKDDLLAVHIDEHTSFNTPEITPALQQAIPSEPSLTVLKTIDQTSDVETKEKKRVVSTVLNFIADNFPVRGNKVVEFSETEHGIIKADFKKLFSKNNSGLGT